MYMEIVSKRDLEKRIVVFVYIYIYVYEMPCFQRSHQK